MRNHLFVETPEPNLSAGMQYLNGSYTSCFNRRHRRAGHLFQGRFKGHLIEEQGCFLEVSRYIHLNPVRAKAVAAAFGYRGHGGVHTALLRIEDGSAQLKNTISHLGQTLDKRLTAL